jgi:hypothetical protein
MSLPEKYKRAYINSYQISHIKILRFYGLGPLAYCN